jgi:outer membrane lipoprotein-sorting protein
MKKAILTLLLLPALSIWAVGQTTPTADEIIANYLTAVGGKDFLSKIDNLVVELSTEMQGNPMVITLKQKAPNKFSRVMIAGGMEVFKMTSDGTKVAMGGMRGNGQVLEGKDAQQIIIQSALCPELHFAEAGVKSTVEGTQKVGGKDAYKVKHSAADGTVLWTDYYDVASGLKTQAESIQKSPRGEMQQITQYLDYKDFKGLKYPSTMVQGNGQFQMQMTVDKVKINDGVKDSEFIVK